MPKGNGNMNEALRIVPEVELNDSSMTSTQAGEIKPGEVSIWVDERTRIIYCGWFAKQLDFRSGIRQ